VGPSLWTGGTTEGGEQAVWATAAPHLFLEEKRCVCNHEHFKIAAILGEVLMIFVTNNKKPEKIV